MKVDRKELLAALTAVQPGLAARELIEQSACVVFDGGRVATYNDEIAVIHASPLPEEIRAAVPGNELIKLLTKCGEDVLDVEVVDTEFRITGKGVRAGLRMQAEIVLPLREIGEPTELFPTPDGFQEAVSFCLISVGDATRPLLQNIHVTAEYAESCDNFRMTRKTFPTAGQIPEEGLLIPSRAARQLSNYKPNEWGRTPGWVHFMDPTGLTFATRTPQDKYPDLNPLMEAEGPQINLPDNLGEILDRAGIFAASTATGDFVEISVSKGVFLVKADGETGWIKERVRSDYDGEPFSFRVTSAFLRDSVQLIHRTVVAPNRLRFEGEGFVHVVALLGPAKPAA